MQYGMLFANIILTIQALQIYITNSDAPIRDITIAKSIIIFEDMYR